MADSSVFSRLGGDPSLDFNNTVSWRDGEPREDEQLQSFEDLVRWAGTGDVIDDETASALTRLAGERPVEASAVLERARAFRRTIHGLFGAIGEGREPDAAALTGLNEFLGRAQVGVRPLSGGRFGWGRRTGVAELEDVLFPVVWSAAQLITSDDIDQVKRCASDTCGWLFIDSSRRHNRRWCDMKDCGNRAKARRYYRRRQENQ